MYVIIFSCVYKTKNDQRENCKIKSQTDNRTIFIEIVEFHMFPMLTKLIELRFNDRCNNARQPLTP